MSKLRSDQTDSVSVDLHYRRLDADGVAFSSDHNWGLLRGPNRSSHSRTVRYRRQSATSGHSSRKTLTSGMTGVKAQQT